MFTSINLSSNSPFKRASVSLIMTSQVNMFELIVYLYVCIPEPLIYSFLVAKTIRTSLMDHLSK